MKLLSELDLPARNTDMLFDGAVGFKDFAVITNCRLSKKAAKCVQEPKRIFLRPFYNLRNFIKERQLEINRPYLNSI